MPVRLFLAGLAVAWLCACGSESSGSEDAGTGDVLDIVAHEIRQYETKPREFCVGRTLRPQFAEYDYQCKDAGLIGECVAMENPHEGNDFFCALCGLKGSNMVCYMINPE